MDNCLNLKVNSKFFEYLENLRNKSNFYETVVFDSIKYEILKSGNLITIKSSEGKCLQLEYKNNVVNFGNGEVDYYTLEARYLFPDGAKLLITDGYRKDSLDNKTIPTSMEYAYISKDEQFHSLSWDDESQRIKYTYGLEFNGEGYIYVDGIDKYVVSADLKSILYINDYKLPTIEELQKFNKDVEQIKLKMIIKQIKFNEVTKGLLKEVLEDLENKETLVNKALELNKTILPKCRKIVEEEKIINLLTSVWTFNKEELIIVLHFLGEIVDNKNKENPEELKKYHI